MGIAARIFGSPEAIKETAGAIRDGVDATIFTREEKAGYFGRLLKLYEPFKLTQRVIAFLVFVPFMGIVTLCALMYMASVFFAPCSTPNPGLRSEFAVPLRAPQNLNTAAQFEAQQCKSQQLMLVSKATLHMVLTYLGEVAELIALFLFGGGFVEGGIRAWGRRKDE